MEADPATLPPLLAQILAYATIILGLLTALAAGLRWLVPQLRTIASRTKTRADDAVVDWLARALSVIATIVDVAQVVLPRVSLGRPADPAPSSTTSTVTVTQTETPAIPDTRPPPPMTGPGGAALALLACLVLPALHGCATWADTARTTIEVSAVAVDVADHSLASALTSTCASVADLPAQSPERAAALDACLHAHHYDDALTAIRVADAALRAAQAAVDAGERIDDKAPWLGAAACLAVAVQQVLVAVEAAGVAVPPALTTGASILAGITGTCEAESIQAADSRQGAADASGGAS